MHINVASQTFTRTVSVDYEGKNNFPFINVGAGTYINDMEVSTNNGNEVINIQIGKYCSIAYNVLLLINRNHDYKSITNSSDLVKFEDYKIKQKGQVIIGNDVWIGNNVIIMSDVTIGNGAVIGAGTVVSKDVPPYAIVAGNPQRILKYRFSEEDICGLQRIKWWNWDCDYIYSNKSLFTLPIDKFIEKYNDDITTVNKNIKDRLSLKGKVYMYILDVNENYSLWEKVINEYINQFSKEDDVSLVIKYDNTANMDLVIDKINSKMLNKSNNPDVLLVGEEIGNEELFYGGDYFLVNRRKDMMSYIDYANDNNFKIMSAVDIPIFE